MTGEHSEAAARNADNICKLDRLGHYWTDGVNGQLLDDEGQFKTLEGRSPIL